MRSIGFTFLLAITATITSGLGIWQWQRGNLDSLFGAPPTPVGSRIYPELKPEQVKHIIIHASGVSAAFSKLEHGWYASSPWNDRMDPRAAASIIQFTFALTAEDSAPVDEVTPDVAGLGNTAVDIRLEDENHRPLAKFRLGGRAPWKSEVKDQPDPIPSVYVQPRDKHRKNHIYVCPGDIDPLFRNGLRFLRDHRPFYFNPLQLQTIRLRSSDGEVTLGRASPKSPWRVSKPLDLSTDPDTVKSLLQGLFELCALQTANRATVTLPNNSASPLSRQISITPFGGSEVTLDILPPETPDARTCRATVSDRPTVVFDLPIKPEPGLVSLANLPLALNDLRDPMLSRLQVAGLKEISIIPATGDPITIVRPPKQPWTITDRGQPAPASETNLYRLLKAVTTTRATDFVSDAATDFTPWGLDRPILRLRFTGIQDESFDLRFGLNAAGELFANRIGSPSVVRIPASFLDAIAVLPFEWRPSKLNLVNRVNLLAIQRSLPQEPPLLLRYKFIDESWTATTNGNDLTPQLDPARANFLVSSVESLEALQWLDVKHPEAVSALANPSMTFSITEKQLDENGEFSGIRETRLVIAPNPSNPDQCFAAMPGSEPHPFLLSKSAVESLAIPLFLRR